MRIFRAMRNFLQGLWEAQKASLAGPLIKAKAHNDDAMMFIVFGELLGYPCLSTFYSRFLLLCMLEELAPWRKRVLKEPDVLEKMND